VPSLVWYISAHGFGHATRDIEVLNEIGRTWPEVHLVVRTQVPDWFMRANLRVPVDLQPAETDPAVVQINSLTIDEAATAHRASAFYADFDTRVAREAGVLRHLDATAVVADIPPLACAAASRLAVPIIAFANFTWDWIYAGFPEFARVAPGVIETIGQAYAGVTHALRLPLSGGFATVRGTVVDLPLVARVSRRSRADVRLTLGIAPEELAVLSSFGGHGLPLDYNAIARSNRFRLIVTDFEQRDSAQAPNLLRLPSDTLSARGLRYEDLVAAADVVVSKPGYGIVSECVANGASLLYASRGRFAEQDVFEREMPRLLRCARIEQEDLLAGRWQTAVESLTAQPAPGAVAAGGARVAADAIQRIARYTLAALPPADDPATR
jgi:L-arabinokinase